MNGSKFRALLRSDPAPEFSFVDPPFKRNARNVAKYPPEVTGYFLLNTLCRRLGWNSLAGKRLLDFGCGIRFTRTIVNLGLDVGSYTGVDVDKEMIAWLSANIGDPRFRFEHLDARNQFYNPGGESFDPDILANRGVRGFNAACMFSVITHQTPDEAVLTFSMLHRCLDRGEILYFTAFVDEDAKEFVEREPDRPGHKNAYPPDLLFDLLEKGGWRVRATYPRSQFQQAAFVCESVR